MIPKNLVITVFPGGYGKALAEAALKRGDRAITISQDIAVLDDLSTQYKDALFVLPLDLTDRKAAFDGIDRLLKTFGQVDAVIDAGFNIIDQDNKASGRQLKALLDNELWGMPWLPQVILPALQREHSGHFIQICSTCRTSLPAFGHFQGFQHGQQTNLEKVAEEIQNQGIKVSFLEHFASNHTVPDGDADDISGDVQVSRQTISGDRFRIRNMQPSFVVELLLDIIDGKELSKYNTQENKHLKV